MIEVVVVGLMIAVVGLMIGAAVVVLRQGAGSWGGMKGLDDQSPLRCRGISRRGSMGLAFAAQPWYG